MTADTNVQSMVINKLTQSQFNDITTPSSTELYIMSANGILAVNDRTITIQKNGTTVDSFTTNAIADKTINITVPTQPSDIGAAASSHNHASNAINAMTGYSKAATASAISTSDTLNAAIGKLEKALDGKQASGSYADASHTHTTADITDLVIPTITDTYDANSSNGMSGKAVASAISTALTSVMRYKGTKASYSALPSTGNVIGDMWNITNADSEHSIKAGDNVAWNGTGWDNMGGAIDLSAYALKSSLAAVATSGKASDLSDIGNYELKANVTSKGSETLPVYFDANGVAKTITSYSGKAATAGTADSANAVAWTGVTGKPESYTPSAHNQASSTINAMTGYAKASSAGAISTSDSLNTAMGKLEKALDGKANSSHSHVGTEVALTGYTKASSAAAVAATDSVNAAIGKLEKALDGKAASSHNHTTSQITDWDDATSDFLTSDDQVTITVRNWS